MINQIDILRAARIKQKINQEQLAKKLNISVRTLIRWELKQREPSYTKFFEWANYLKVPLSQLHYTTKELNYGQINTQSRL